MSAEPLLLVVDDEAGILRRGLGQDVQRVVHANNVEIDLTRRLVKRDGELVSVTRTEWLLLQHLAANAGKVMLNTELLSKVWGPEYRDDLQYLRVWVSRLRRKLGAEPGEPGRIKTFQGIGYLLDIEGTATDAPVGAGDRSGTESPDQTAAEPEARTERDGHLEAAPLAEGVLRPEN